MAEEMYKQQTGQQSADYLRRKHLAFRAKRRGIREMDLLLGAYADKYIEALNAADLQAFEHIMAYEDNDLLAFFTGEIAIPADIDHKLFYAVLAGQTPAA